MITNFEDITCRLNPEEAQMLPTLVEIMKTKTGSRNAITSGEINYLMKQSGHVKIYGARIRKLIHYIRIENLVPRLIATSKGYYIPSTKQEFAQYIKSLEERILSIQQIKAEMIKQNLL